MQRQPNKLVRPSNAKNREGMEDPPEIVKIRELCPSFRILIIGKANSGKTTILQKMCGTTDTPIVHDRDGKQIDPSVLEDPTAMRGMHDIENEITYPSNPHFIFHDSRGFEAGSTEEIEKVRSFINRRSNQEELKDRLHVIWYCIPMDQDRVLSTAELSFFEHGTGEIPVMALFTKWDGQIIRSFGELYQGGRAGKKIRDAKMEAPEHALAIFQAHYLPVINNTSYPPATYLQLGYMNKPEATCSELAEKTAETMDNDVLKKLFISVQRANIKLTMRTAIRDTMTRFMPSNNQSADLNKAGVAVIVWFSHIWVNDESVIEEQYEKKASRDYVSYTGYTTGIFAMHTEYTFYYKGRHFHADGIVEAFKSSLPVTSMLATVNQTLLVLDFICAVAAASHQTFTLRQPGLAAVEEAVKNYCNSSQFVAVKGAIRTMAPKYWGPKIKPSTTHDDEAVADELTEICWENQLG